MKTRSMIVASVLLAVASLAHAGSPPAAKPASKPAPVTQQCKDAARNAAVGCGTAVVGAGAACAARNVPGCITATGVAVARCTNDAINVKNACSTAKPSAKSAK